MPGSFLASLGRHLSVVGVSPGLSFAIDRAKWKIGFLSASVLICGRNIFFYAKNAGLLCRLFLALLLSGVKIISSTSIFRSFAGHSYFNAKGDSSRSK